ncbi:MAG TPA: zinc-binding dehydrogenase [Bacteroidales bacterium]|nr:zinc-binding dehydrogenase [Bacteroidales bacterium]
MSLPKTMKAIQLNDYNSNLLRVLAAMRVAEIPVPQPATNQVLVRVEASPVNPSDLAFLRGGYNVRKTLPAIAGFEGAGTIVSVGERSKENLIGKRVTFYVNDDRQGAWTEYVALSDKDYFVVDKDMPVEQAACLFINPFTAWALVEHVQKGGHKTVIQSAANGQVGKFIRHFALSRNIEVINLVRKPEQVEALKNEGVKHVLNISDDNFDEQLQALAFELKATAAIDAVGGELSGKLFNAIGDNGEVIVYGGLSGQPLSGFDTLGAIFKSKTIRGFNLNGWISEKTSDEFEKVSETIQSLFTSGELATQIQASFPLDRFVDGIRQYISAMSSGKILLLP